MRSTLSIIAVLLIIFGVSVLGYQGITYTKHENIVQVGDMQITAETQKTISVHPLIGGLSLAAGIVLLVFGRVGKK